MEGKIINSFQNHMQGNIINLLWEDYLIIYKTNTCNKV